MPSFGTQMPKNETALSLSLTCGNGRRSRRTGGRLYSMTCRQGNSQSISIGGFGSRSFHRNVKVGYFAVKRFAGDSKIRRSSLQIAIVPGKPIPNTDAFGLPQFQSAEGMSTGNSMATCRSCFFGRSLALRYLEFRHLAIKCCTIDLEICCRSR